MPGLITAERYGDLCGGGSGPSSGQRSSVLKLGCGWDEGENQPLGLVFDLGRAGGPQNWDPVMGFKDVL